MPEDFLIVHKSILPECLPAVLEAKRLLDSGKTKNISQAVKQAGISRSTFYKYKDFVLEPSVSAGGRNAVLSMQLSHETGVLSAVLGCISDAQASVLTITQSLPIHGKASVTVSIDISRMHENISALLTEIGGTEGVENPKLIAVE